MLHTVPTLNPETPNTEQLLVDAGIRLAAIAEVVKVWEAPSSAAFSLQPSRSAEPSCLWSNYIVVYWGKEAGREIHLYERERERGRETEREREGERQRERESEREPGKSTDRG